MRKSISICCLVICLNTNLFSQHLPITVYNPRNGALVNGAISIFQDSRGWMWFASGYDVIRYDGNEFKLYPPASGTLMNFCYEVLQVDDEIWVLSNPYPLKVRGDSLYPVSLGNFNQELINTTKAQGRQFILAANGLHTYENGKFQPFITGDNLAIKHTPTAVETFKDSLILTYKYNEAFIIFDIYSKRFQIIDLPVLDIQQVKSGIIYLLIKNRGIVLLKDIIRENEGGKLVQELLYPLKTEEFGFAADYQQYLWLYHQGKDLTLVTPGGERQRYTEADGLPNTEFNKSFIDREGNLWLAFANGLCKIVRSDISRYTRDQGLAFNYVLYFSDGPADILFISTRNGLSALDNGKVHDVLDKNGIFSCAQIIKGKGPDYFFIRDSSLFSAQFDAGQYRIYGEKNLGSFPGLAIQLAMDKEGNIFVATTEGLFAYNSAKGIMRISVDSAYYRYLLVDKLDRLWAGEFVGGLHGFIIQNNQPKNFSVRKFIYLDTIKAVRAISADNDGNLLVGTRYNSLYWLWFRQDSLGGLVHFSEKDGVNSNNIWGISTDSSGAFWIASSGGLNKLVQRKNGGLITDEGASRQIYQATHVFTAKDNRIWVGNHPGVVVFNNSPRQSSPFSVMITDISVNGKTIDPTNPKNKFSHRENNVNIAFSANTYIDENGVLYSYQLAGNRKDEWSKPMAIHSVNFTSLGPGTYTVRIKAINTNGQWSENEAYYSFSILPPFWQQAWFLALVILLALLGLYILYRYRVRRMRELFEMRNVIASDLHDEIGSTLTSINILSKVSFNNLQKDQEKASTLLKEVIEQSQQIQQSMSDIVWAIKPDNDKVENMISRMREYVNYTLEPKEIKITFEIGESIRNETFDMQQRRDFFLIFKEAVTNIAKYSEADHVQLQMDRQNGNNRLFIKDDGKGFSLTARPSTNGLTNMVRRAESLKGTIHIESAPGKGTSIELVFPAT